LLAGVGTLACGLVYWLSRELFDASAALLACLVAAVSPPFIALSVMLLSETVFAAALLASLLGLTKLVRFAPITEIAWRPALVAVFAGLLCGAATLVRPTWLLVGPAFTAVYVLRARDRLRGLLYAVLLLSGLAIALAPWTIRNFRVTGHFVV